MKTLVFKKKVEIFSIILMCIQFHFKRSIFKSSETKTFLT